ncbi:hypothetical protein, partial [Pseudomonas asplenii]|uniref:hypothetical protein n=1 Tax=Pseudomonas asplenii TaxID=53407 RepID=UPI001E488D3D
YIVASGMWHLSFNFTTTANNFTKENPLLVILPFAIIGIAFRIAGRNSQLGLKSIYSGKQKLVYLVTLPPLLLIGLIILVMK